MNKPKSSKETKPETEEKKESVQFIVNGITDDQIGRTLNFLGSMGLTADVRCNHLITFTTKPEPKPKPV